MPTPASRFAIAAVVLSSLSLPAKADLILHYDMEEPSGSIVDEIGGLAAAPVDTGHAYGVAGPTGFGNAVSLAANGSWQLSVADSALLKNLANDFSVAAWVYVDSTVAAGKTGVNATLSRIIGDDAGWDADGWAMGIFNDGRVRFTKNGIVDVDITPSPAIPFDEWAHFAATVSSTGGTSLFVNGISVGSNGNVADCITGLGNNGFEDPWGIGRTYGIGEDQWFAGSLDEVKVYDEVLNQAQVQDLMVPVRDPALVADIVFNATGTGVVQVLNIDIENGGDDNDLVISGVELSGVDAADFSVGVIPGAIAPGSTVPLPINFTPSGGKTTYEATAEIASNDPQVPDSIVNMTITVLDPSIVAAGAIDFGTLPFGGGAMNQNLTVTNSGGTQDLTISALGITGPAAANFSISAVPPPIAPGGSINLVVTFDPMGGEGGFTAQLDISSNAAGNAVASIPLSAQVEIGDLDSHLVSHFTFDDPNALGNDSGSFDNDGTPMGDATFSSDSKIGGGALALDGDGDVIVVPGGVEYSSLDDDGDGFTVATWVRFDAAAAGIMRIFSTYMPGDVFTGDGWGVGTDGPGAALLATTYGVLDYRSLGMSTPAAGEWHHLTYVLRNIPISAVDYYVDGLLAGSTSGASGLNDTTADFNIGSLGLGTALHYFNGDLDDLRVYDFELSAGNIATVMAAQPAPVTEITVVSYEAGELAFEFVSLPGREYSIFRSTNSPADGFVPLEDWDELTDDHPSGGDTTTYTDSNIPADATQAFYRVGLTPQ